MPFGLKSVPGTFHKTKDVVLSTVKWQFALVYLDDTFVFPGIPEEHTSYVQHVLTLPNNTEATLKLKKCEYFRDTIHCLDQVIRT